jgi:four helix bundle protein
MSDYRKLRVWLKAHETIVAVYRSTQRFPSVERYGLTLQIRRAAAIPSNLAEGSGRKSPGEFSRFVKISLGSASELEYQLLLARDLGYLAAEEHLQLAERVDHVKRMLGSLIESVAARSPKPMQR